MRCWGHGPRSGLNDPWQQLPLKMTIEAVSFSRCHTYAHSTRFHNSQVPPTLLYICLSGCPSYVSFGIFIAKVLGQTDMFVFWGSLGQMAGASDKVLWRVPPTVLLYMRLPVSYSTQCCVNSRHLSSLWTSTLCCSLLGYSLGLLP